MHELLAQFHVRARRSEQQALRHHHRATATGCKVLHHQRHEQQLTLLAVGGQVGAD